MNKKNTFRIASLLFVLFRLLAAQELTTDEAANNDLFEIKFQKLADDIYFAYRPNPVRMVEGNVLFVINESDVIVFDGSAAPVTARKIINKIKEVTANPVSFVIISHGHEDHMMGLQGYIEEFPNVEILGRPDLREYMDTRVRERTDTFVERYEKNRKEGKYEEEFKELVNSGKLDPAVIEWYRNYYFNDLPAKVEQYRELKLTLPTMTFTGDQITFYRNERTIEILHLGYGHTSSDILLYLPHEKILATGDIITEPLPFGFTKDPESWLTVIKKIKNIDFNILVPGHGKVMYDKKYLDKEIEMIEYVNSKVAELVNLGRIEDEIKTSLDIRV
jgi:cyclase